jgi:hypothetical protein
MMILFRWWFIIISYRHTLWALYERSAISHCRDWRFTIAPRYQLTATIYGPATPGDACRITDEVHVLISNNRRWSIATTAWARPELISLRISTRVSSLFILNYGYYDIVEPHMRPGRTRHDWRRRNYPPTSCSLDELASSKRSELLRSILSDNRVPFLERPIMLPTAG